MNLLVVIAIRVVDFLLDMQKEVEGDISGEIGGWE